jgi:3-deoxy-D-manno-octulosonic-acid transferase
LKQNKIPSYLVSALFKGHHPFFKWYGGIFRDSLHTFVRLLVQDQESKHLLAKIGIDRVQVLGDTRFDRVLDIKATPDDDSIIREFKGNSKLIIAGSTWPKDETLVLQAFESLRAQGCKLIIAPHEVEARFTINTIKKINAHGFSYSIYKQDPDTTVDVMIIDTIGRLSKLYRYADLAYVGGGFNGGLHNVLEPTVYGIPVAFYAENYGKFNEAVDLITLGVAKTAADANQLAATWQKQLFDESYRKQVKEDSQSYFNVNGYVTEKVLQAMAL